MEHYITLFDSLFLPQGLALHASLTRHAGSFTLWILCMDQQTKNVLDSLNLANVRPIFIADVETPELLQAKATRKPVEYYWTLTPFTPKIVFDRAPEVQRVTYLDADVFLLKSPRPIFEEFERSGKAVMITDHAYDAEYDQTTISGQYCVQFMVFVRKAGEPVRQWWQDRCIEWCFDRPEDGKLGDQKYLDDWPTRFPDLVHVLSQLDALLAPWNARRFPYSRAIAWHFHGLRILKNRRILLHSGYHVPKVVDEAIYLVYMRELNSALTLLRRPVVQKVIGNRFVSASKFFLRNLASGAVQMSRRDVIRRLS